MSDSADQPAAEPAAPRGPAESDLAVSAGGLERAIKAIAGVIAPTTLITALGFYFGYVSTDAFYEFFGVDAATLQFSSQDYLLRSVGALYVPVGFVLLVSLLIIFASPFLAERTRPLRDTQIRIALRAALIVAAGLVLFGISGIVLPVRAGQNSLFSPLCIVAGVLLAYAVHGLRASRRVAGHTAGGRTTAGRTATAGLVAALVVIGSFWAANTYAERWGRGQATVLAGDLRLRPAVLLDTRESLFLQLPGVQETALPTWTKDQQFHYRYRGLRLLAQSGDRMFFIPTDWAPGQGEVVMLTDNDSIRVQFSPG